MMPVRVSFVQFAVCAAVSLILAAALEDAGTSGVVKKSPTART